MGRYSKESIKKASRPIVTSKYLSDNAIRAGLLRGKFQVIEECLESKCCVCGEFWPHTSEHYYREPRRGVTVLKGRCKACFIENRHYSQIPKTTVIGRPKTINHRDVTGSIN